MVPFFSQELECLIVSFDVSFRSCLLESHLVILTLGQDMTSTYILSLKPLSEEISSLTQHFLFSYKGNHGANPMCFGELLSSLIMPPSIQIRFEDEAR
jgi:hypothetical protein